jgi:hypothetical protein
MSYIINGPVTIGNTATSTQLNGNVSVPDTSTHTGDIFYTSNTSGLIAALQHSSAAVLLSDAGTSLPVWLPNPVTVGQVLTSNGTGVNPSWQTPASEVGSYGFSANYTNATAQTTTQATASGTLTQTGFVVTGVSGGPFTAAMVGGKLVYGGSNYYITGFLNSTTISVFPANTQVGAVAYTITYGTPVILTNWNIGTAPFFNTTGAGPDFNPATGTFTNTTNAIGKFILTCGVTFTDSANNGFRVLQVLRTSGGTSTVVFQAIRQANADLSMPQTLTVDGALRLVTGDTVQIQLASTGTGTTTAVASTAADGTASTWWSMMLQGTS